MHPELARFEAPVRHWFCSRFAELSPPQALGWPAIAGGRHTLILAPTGSGKTLAAFLWSINLLVRDLARGTLDTGVHTLYVSPLKALSYDIEKNLGEPLAGIRKAAIELGLPAHPIALGVRTGDTPAWERAAMIRKPPHILITTPESFFLVLSSPRAREILRSVRYVIVDEIHALCGNKRGAHLALSLERLDHLTGRKVIRIGLSATQRPVEEVARFLGGSAGQLDPLANAPPAGTDALMGNPDRHETCADVHRSFRPVDIVDTGMRKALNLKVISPVGDFSALPGDSIWPEVYPPLIDLIQDHRSTLVFVQMRSQAERISADLNELAGEGISRAHHGSISRPLRRELEDALKDGKLRSLVATGTLELGIDVGAIDLVVQIQSPGSVTRGLQRVGRAGHLLGAESSGCLIATYREDLVESAVIARRMLEGKVEALRVPPNPLDVLAQHVAAAACLDEWTEDGLLELCRRAYPYQTLTRALLVSVLELLSGRNPAPTAVRSRSWVTWDRASGRVRGLSGSLASVLRHAGTIPDHGYYGLYLADGETRLGELEEEFVYEIQSGDVIRFGTSSWLVEDIDSQRVLVRPAHGLPGRVPFWKGGLFGRDPELSEAIGAFRRELAGRVHDPDVKTWLAHETPVDERAADALIAYFKAQADDQAAVPSDRVIAIEHFLSDDLQGHWVAILSTFGGRVNAPLAMAARRILRLYLGMEPQVLWDDNAILFRSPASDSPVPLDILSRIHSSEVEDLVLAELVETPMFGTVFRHNAARFLVLTGRSARRTPLWLQRLRARNLLEAVRDRADYPVTIESYRECLTDLMDMEGLVSLLQRIEAEQVTLVHRDVDYPSPMAAGLVYKFMDNFMYEYDEPLAERRLRSLHLDRELLAQLLGRGELADLLDPSVIRDLEDEWQGRASYSRARDADELFQHLITLGDLPWSHDDPTWIDERCQSEAIPLVQRLLDDGRALVVNTGGRQRLVPAEGLDHLRLALFPASIEIARGSPPSPDLDLDAELTPALAREERVLRAISRLGPACAQDLVVRVGLPPSVISEILDRLTDAGQLHRGRFVHDKPEPQYCTRINIEIIHRRSLAALRKRARSCSLQVFQAFLVRHQHLTPQRRLVGEDGLFTLVEQLAGRLIPAEILEREVLHARFDNYQPEWLTRPVASGEIGWSGLPSEGGRKRRIALYFVEDRELFLARPTQLPVERLQPPSTRPPTSPAEVARPSQPLRLDVQTALEGSRNPPLLPPEDGQDESGSMTPCRPLDLENVEESAIEAIRSALTVNGASFLTDLLSVTGLDQSIVVPTLWEMVWRGEITNDSIDTLRTAIATGFRPPESNLNVLTGRPSQFRTGAAALHRQRGRQRSHRPLSSGRWWLLQPDAVSGSWNHGLAGDLPDRQHPPAVPENRHLHPTLSPHDDLPDWPGPGETLGVEDGLSAVAERLTWQLLLRFGLLSKELVSSDDLQLTWGRAYRTLQRLEFIGQVRRGYFVEGLSGAQFALPAAADELMALGGRQPEEAAVLLNASDPAILPALPETPHPPWPFAAGFSRVPTAYLVHDQGLFTLWAEGLGRHLHFNPDADAPQRDRAIQTLITLTRRTASYRPVRRIEVESIDGQPALSSPLRPELESEGFRRHESALVYPAGW